MIVKKTSSNSRIGKVILNPKNYQITLKNKRLKFVGGGKTKIRIATIDNQQKWVIGKNILLDSRKGYFDSGPLYIFAALVINEGILLIYYTKKPFAIGAALFDKAEPEKLLWRSANPIWQSTRTITPNKITKSKRTIIIYLETPEGMKSIKFLLDYLFGTQKPVSSILSNIPAPLLSKTSYNPILEPNLESHWECCATFNTAALYLDKKVHFIYRAIGINGSSVLGYAVSKDGIHIDDRLSSPIYIPTQPFECRQVTNAPTFSTYHSGCGWGGCEDPRLTKIDDHIYMTYTAFNGCTPPAVALTSIAADDFLHRNWRWAKPILISPKGEIHKNWALFPKKIRGKYAIIHSISPKILIDYLDDVNFKDKDCIQSYYGHSTENNHLYWDKHVRGIGPPPIETKDGWLLFYHAMDQKDPGSYKIGAMMLDKNDPGKILYRSSKPVLAPERKYENQGVKPNVIYSCGAVVIDNTLIIYYGGADTVICAAVANFTEFLTQLKNFQLPIQGVVTTVL